MTCPLITVSCNRDLALLELQAQSFDKYLPDNTEIIIIVNEINRKRDTWYNYFYSKIEKYYKRHKLVIYNNTNFKFDWSVDFKQIEVTGWNRQQVLKLLVSEKVSSKNYCVLDSQNFLVKPWDPKDVIKEDKSPYVLNKLTWSIPAYQNYLKILGGSDDFEQETMTASTPAFLNSDLVKKLITINGGTASFANWFYNFSESKSEFALYLAWSKVQGGLNKYHYSAHTWCHPMLRDSLEFSKDFDYFINAIARFELHTWASINHRSWVMMDEQQYSVMLNKLKEYDLAPDLTELRKTYVFV